MCGCVARLVQTRKTYRRDVGKISRPHDSTLIPVPKLQETLAHEKDIVCLLVPVEARRIGQDGGAQEDGHAIASLLLRGEDAENTLAARDGDAFTFELIDDVVRPSVGRGGLHGDGHFVDGAMARD